VRVTDLDSGAGFTGAVLIERVVINGLTERDRLRKALESCGPDRADLPRGRDNREHRLRIYVEALMSYGYCTPVETMGVQQEIIQTFQDGPMIYDGWRANRRLSEDEDLRDYIESTFIDW
jgi:hypothetical protein